MLVTMLETVTGWTWLNPSPQGNDINALWLEKRGRWPMRELWAVGNCGTVLRWNHLRFETMPFGEVVNLRAIWGTAANDLWLAGEGGMVFHFDGQAFFKHLLPHPAVAVINALHGFATGDVWAMGALRDGGEAVAFHWDGERWTEFPVDGATIAAVWGPRPDDVWAVGYRGTVLHFDGSAWTRSTMGTDRNFHAVAGLEGQTWIAGQGGALLLNEGDGFRRLESGTHANLKAVAAMTPRLTVAAGASGTVVLALDRKFAPVQSMSTEIACMAALPGHIVWMGGRGGVLVSEMVGMSDFAPSSLRCRLSAIWGTDDDVWVAGRNVVARYRGDSWQHATIGQGFAVNALWGSGADDVWAAADNALLLHWNGRAWSPYQLPFNEHLRALFGFSRDDIWAVGANGVIVHYDGREWVRADFDGAIGFTAIWGANPDRVWAVGWKGGLAHWNGKRWAAEDSGTTELLWSIWGRSEEDVWVAGRKNVVLRRQKGAWRREELPPECGRPDWPHVNVKHVAGDDRRTVLMTLDGRLLIHEDGRYRVEAIGSEALKGLLIGKTHDWVIGDAGRVLRRRRLVL